MKRRKQEEGGKEENKVEYIFLRPFPSLIMLPLPSEDIYLVTCARGLSSSSEHTCTWVERIVTDAVVCLTQMYIHVA